MKNVAQILSSDDDITLTEEQAADYLGYSRSSLNHWRQDGKGPKFIKFKSRSVRYKMSDLRAWQQETSTGPVQSVAEAKSKAVS